MIIINFITYKLFPFHIKKSDKIMVGGYSKVYKSIYKGVVCAIKIMPKTCREMALSEANMMKYCNDKKMAGVPLVYNLFEAEDDEFLYLIMEYIAGGDLFTLIIDKGIEYDKIWMMKEIIGLVWELHKLGIAHLDIKLENIMYDGERLFLIDFGTSKFIEFDDKGNEKYLTDIRGTDYYMAPEVSSGKYYGKPADIYSLGKVLEIVGDGLWEEVWGDMVIDRKYRCGIWSLKNNLYI